MKARASNPPLRMLGFTSLTANLHLLIFDF